MEAYIVLLITSIYLKDFVIGEGEFSTNNMSSWIE